MSSLEIENLKKQYMYIYNVFAISLAQYELLKKLKLDYESFNQKEIVLIVIQSLLDAIVTNLTKIINSSRENKITINILKNNYNKYVKESKKEGNSKLEFICFNSNEAYTKACNSIKSVRNTIIAHSTLENLSDDFIKDNNLFLHDFEVIFNCLSEILDKLCFPINGIRLLKGNREVKKFGGSIADIVLAQYKIAKEYNYKSKLAFDYMSKNCPYKLLEIIYKKPEGSI